MFGLEMSREEFNHLFPGLIQKERKMENDYSTELKDLEAIYGNTLGEINSKYDIRLKQLVSLMESFLECYKAKAVCKAKLEVLNAKLKAEEMNEEDENSNEHCC